MTSPALEFDLRNSIRTIPDYPKPGIIFRDITTLLGNPRAFRACVPGVADRRDDSPQYEDAADGLVLGGLPDDH